MENNENLVIENVTEELEQTPEQTPKTYTQAEFNAKLDEVLGKKIARKEAKLRKEYERKYGDLTAVLRAGTGKEDVQELTEAVRDLYAQKGVSIPSQPAYSQRDLQVLAKAEAEDIIRLGYEEVVEEVERMAKLGLENMSPRDKAVFQALAQYRVTAERARELSKIGVSQAEYESPEFTAFAAQFNPNTPSQKIYELYEKTIPQKEFKTMGTMKSAGTTDDGVKDYYAFEEAKRFTKRDFDRNPKLFAAVQRSMTKW